ncbi:MAG: DUF4214 domain-containing protein [Proteobacteria bacterium]|nr:DUF4214 domain-containing protein [Pseudomonadota bacterium]
MNLNMELYNSSGQVIAANLDANGPLGKEHIDYQTSTGGDYFVKIYYALYPSNPPAGTQFTYNLGVSLPDKSWMKTLDFGPIRNASVAVFDIDNDGKDEIFVGTSKALDAAGNEIRPAGLICLEDDGTVKWSTTFAAASGPDSITGKTYNTTSVSTPPLFTDVDGDGKIDIVVGVGGDLNGEFGAVGQPGDKGGVYALNADGTIKWFHQNSDSFGNDGRPDGTAGAPVAFDLDGDGVREIIYEGLDHNLWILDGRTGVAERSINLHDTAGATPAIADLNQDGVYEIVAPADITANPTAGIPTTGGILHVFSNYGAANVSGWTQQIGTTTSNDYRGRLEEQSLWSSPQVADLDGNGTLEIIQGTGNFFQDSRGSYIDVWNAAGDLRNTLVTHGRTLAAPLVADLNGDGSKEIIGATLSGYVEAWNSAGQLLFSTHVVPYGSSSSAQLPIANTPIAVDMDGDGKLEILVSIGGQQAVLNSAGVQISSTAQPVNVFGTYSGSPVAKDIDNDGHLDLLSGGTTIDQSQAVVYRWQNLFNVTSADFRDAKYQAHESLSNIDGFVARFYQKILNRVADPTGDNYWVDNLYTGVKAGADVARGFIFSQEFINRNFTDSQYVDVLYRAFFDRAPDTAGFNDWLSKLQAGTTRSSVLDGFIFSQEFGRLCANFGIKPAQSFGTDTGNGNDTLTGTPDADVFRSGAGNDTIIDQGSSLPTSPTDKFTYGSVYRLYGATLGREPDAAGFIGWVDPINAGSITLTAAAGAFVNSQEFKNTYGTLDNTQFVTQLYKNVLGRQPDAAGLNAWVSQLNAGKSRAEVVLGFSESAEYQNNTVSGLDNFMRTAEPKWNDVLEGGTGDDKLAGGRGADIYVFRNGAGGNDTIYGFEPWDELQLSGFGFASGADAIGHMVQNGSDVVFNFSGQIITFKNMTLAELERVRYNVS